MYALYRLWTAYKISKSEANIDKMVHYARAIQEVQEDIGFKTTSFPHLGIYGDNLIFNDHRSRGRKIAVEVDHSHLKEKAQLEEEKKKLEENVSLPILLEPDEEKGEELITIADEIPKPPGYRKRHSNTMHYEKAKEEEWYCENCEEMVPLGKNHICDSRILTLSDDIPFQDYGN